MKRRHIFNTIIKKYIFGYVLVGFFLLFFLLLSVCANQYVSGKYRQATKLLTEINDLEKALMLLNDDVNVSYSYLNTEGVEQYPALLEKVTQCLERTKLQLADEYIRETADLNYTVESYTEAAGWLISSIEAYMERGRAASEENGALLAQYDSLQQIYSYMSLRFQDVYSVKLDRLTVTENKLQQLQITIFVLETGLLILVTAICAAYIFTVIKGVAASIHTLREGVNSIEKNVYEAKPIHLRCDDELEELAAAFNSMLKIIQMQMYKIAEDADIRERLTEAEKDNLRIYGELQKNHLDFLQARINPHFLFNTLNMISAQARVENAEKSAVLMEITASFLRYNLDNITHTVTLEKELQNLRDYIDIQRCRYGKRFSFDFDVEKSCYALSMPCMILQPLVENSIRHGIGMMLRDGRVCVRGCLAGERVVLEISDNGVGMTEEQMEEIYRNIDRNYMPGNHIGILNIYKRLQLFYKGETSLTFLNLNPGLRITISLPYQTQEMQNGATGEQYEINNGDCG